MLYSNEYKEILVYLFSFLSVPYLWTPNHTNISVY